jgi:hypothetical protein
MFDSGEHDRPNQISSPSFIVPRPPRFARSPTRLGLLVLLLEPLKSLLKGDNLLIQLWHSDCSDRSQF